MTNEKSEPEVIVYSTQTCPYCVRAKEYLTAKGIKYKDYDVSIDRQKAKEMVDASGQMGVPVLQINGRIIVGFNVPLINDALSKKPLRKREDVIGNIVFDPFSQ
ncbi:MAG: glutaredoxin domain-containing protein [Candidatus Micrarchaeota archaeon]